MVCFHPLKGYRSRSPSANGGYRIVFNVRDGYADKPQSVPCGQCSGCRLERSRQWAVRCMHEARMHEDNCFITLTYSDDNIPDGGTLIKSDFQKFMKRLRKHVHVTAGKRVRYYMAGEYGDLLGRPHYHVCLFGYDFADKVPISRNSQGDILYVSVELDKLWNLGISQLGAVTFESAAYCARYVMKKVTGKAADAYYEMYDLETGEIFYRQPEYNDMSRRPGIGQGWFDTFNSDVYPRDYVVVNGVKARPPRYYDNKYEIVDPDRFARLKARRVRNARKHEHNNTPDRLKVREEVQLARIKSLKRSVD